MAEKTAFLCDTCPAKNVAGIDLDLYGSCSFFTLDSFRQTRGYRLEHAHDYASNDEMAEMSSSALRYYDEETDETYEGRGDLAAARMGILCAENFLNGDCSKDLAQILRESEIDF